MGSEIDLKKLDKALEQFGSLQKAIEALQAHKLELENDIAQLSASKTKLEQEVASLETRRTSLSGVLEKLDAAFKEKWWQYVLFTGFMSLVSAQDAQDIERFVASAQQWVKVSPFIPTLAREQIIMELMGSVVKAFRCSSRSCGAQFLVNRKSLRSGGDYRCPACDWKLHAEPDDSMLSLFLSPERIEKVKELEVVQAEVERLKPLEVFMDIPCAVCGKAMPNDRQREQVERIFKACGMAHPECWETPFGKVVHKEAYLRLLHSHEALSTYERNPPT
jgi:predicted RNA-binding Zn-ribbon protein involved in translation (DUF1610 family)